MTIEQDIASAILDQPNELSSLITVFDILPYGLTSWFMGIARNVGRAPEYTEIDFSIMVNTRLDVYPGDMIVRRNRDIQAEDIVEVGLLMEDHQYVISYCRVLKMNFREGTLTVQNIEDDTKKVELSMKNQLCVIDLHQFGSPEWNAIATALEIDFDTEKYLTAAQAILENVIDAEPFDKQDEIIEKLKSRISELQ
jgi:hypothetical protein